MDTARKAHDSIRYIGAEEVLAAISPQRAIDAVERALAGLDRGEVRAPKAIGEAVPDGTFHVKACAGASGDLARLYVAKVNANFPQNMARHGMPTIQGAILAFDTQCGKLLAVVESASITMLRTAAATAVAFRHLARKRSKVAAIVGCGAQGEAHLRVLAHVLPIESVYLFDMDSARARSLAERAAGMGLPFTVSTRPQGNLRRGGGRRQRAEGRNRALAPPVGAHRHGPVGAMREERGFAPARGRIRPCRLDGARPRHHHRLGPRAR